MVILSIVFNLDLAELPFTPSDRSVAADSLVLTTPKPEPNITAEQIQAARQALEARQFASAVRMFESVLAGESAALNAFSADFADALQGMAEELLAQICHRPKAPCSKRWKSIPPAFRPC
jgi:hypothetical protein